MAQQGDATCPSGLVSILTDLGDRVDKLTRVVGDLERQLDQFERAA